MTHPHIIKIVGMPRSGTGFAATILGLHPYCMSYHELAAYDKNWKRTLMNNGCDYVVDATTYGHLEQATIPHTVAIYLNRDAASSHEASKIAFQKPMDPVLFDRLHLDGLAWVIKNDAEFFNTGEVFTLAGMKRLWELSYANNLEFPTDKMIQLQKMNIQHHNGSVIFGDKEFKI